jgi:hypothetical protein
MGAGFPAKTQSPKKWAAGLCASMSEWRDVAVNGADEMRTKLSGTNPSLAEVRHELASYLGDVSDATAKAADDVKALGPPDTPKGRKIARGMVKVFTGIAVSMERLQHRARGISVSDEATAKQQLTAIQRDVNQVFSQFGTQFTRLKRYDAGRKLDKAFDATKACQTLDS